MSLCFLFVSLAALCAAGSSFALAHTLRRGGSSGSYLFNYFFTCFLISLFLNKIPFSLLNFSPQMALLGFVVGILVAGLMWATSKAVKNGPSGLSFAFQNSGAVFPPILMALLFSQPFGFNLTAGNLVGMVLVLVGLFYAAKGSQTTPLNKKWVIFAILAFLFQGLILSLFQWRCLLLQTGLPFHTLLPFSCPPEADIWFMPALFFFAWVYQTLYLFFSEKRFPNLVELTGGGLGGIVNGLSTFFLLKATFVATETEKIMLFPIFTVTIIFLCNLIGKIFYRESISWKANAIAALGIWIGTTF